MNHLIFYLKKSGGMVVMVISLYANVNVPKKPKQKTTQNPENV